MHMKPIPCMVERYRTYTAHCNNLKNPSWGAANTPFVRYLPPVYSDGMLRVEVFVFHEIIFICFKYQTENKLKFRF